MLFPFLPSHYEVIYENSEYKEKRLKREKLKREKKKLPDDLIQFICLIDTYNFTETDAYSYNGIALHLAIKRTDVEIFLDNLKKEHQEFQRKYRREIKKYNDEYT